MVTLEDAEFVRKERIYGGIMGLVDIGSRNIVTLQKQDKFLGIFSYEGYADEFIEVYKGSLNSGDTHYIITTLEGVVFHAKWFPKEECARKSINPVIENSCMGVTSTGEIVFDESKFEEKGVKKVYKRSLELLELKRGGWLAHLKEVEKILCEPQQLEQTETDYISFGQYLAEMKGVPYKKVEEYRDPIKIIRKKFPKKQIDLTPLVSILENYVTPTAEAGGADRDE